MSHQHPTFESEALESKTKQMFTAECVNHEYKSAPWEQQPEMVKKNWRDRASCVSSEIPVVDKNQVKAEIVAAINDVVRHALGMGKLLDALWPAIQPYLHQYGEREYLRTSKPVSVALEDAVRALWNTENTSVGFSDYDVFKDKYPNDCKAHAALFWETAEICAKAWGLSWKN